MGMKIAERHIRDQTLFYMEQSVVNLSQNAAISITKAPELKKFLLFLVEREPKRMNGILKTVSERASAAVITIEARKEQERIAAKRAAPSDVDSPEICKRAKLAATVSGTGANIRVRASTAMKILTLKSLQSCDKDTVIADRVSVEPPPYSSNSNVEYFRVNTEIDDGVELATPNPGNNMAQEKNNTEEPAEDAGQDQNEEDDDENDARTHNEVRPAHVQKGKSAPEDSERLNQPADSQDDDMLQDETRGRIAEEQTTQTDTQDNLSNNASQQMSKTKTPYEIECALTNGKWEIISKLRINSIILNKPEAIIAFIICRKLDFVLNRFALVKYFKNCRAKIGTDKITDCVPSTYDLIDPDDIYDALSITQAHSHAAKIKRAYGQMRLFESVNKEAEEQVASGVDVPKYKLYLWHLEKRAIGKAGNVSDDEKKAIIQSYRNEYLAGSKWTDVCKWFGGTGVVLVFVLAGS